MEIRKIVQLQEDVLLEGGRPVPCRIRRYAAMAVVVDPNAGKYVEDLQDYIDFGDKLGHMLAEMAIAALGRDAIE